MVPSSPTVHKSIHPLIRVPQTIAHSHANCHPLTSHLSSIQFVSSPFPCLIHQVCHLISENLKQRSYRTKHIIPSVRPSGFKNRNVGSDADVITYLRISLQLWHISFFDSDCGDHLYWAVTSLSHVNFTEVSEILLPWFSGSKSDNICNLRSCIPICKNPATEVTWNISNF